MTDWTQEQTDELTAIYASPERRQLLSEFSARVGRSRKTVVAKACNLGLSRRQLRQPCRATWLRIASEEAGRALVPLNALLAGSRHPRACVARRAAWRRLVSEKNYSIAGIARVSGFHHTTILYALGRLDRIPPRETCAQTAMTDSIHP